MSLELKKNDDCTLSFAWFSVWPVARTAMHLVFRRKLFWLLFAIAMLSFVFTFGAIYLLATLKQELPQMARFISSMLKDLDGSGTTYLNFMKLQGTVMMILLAFAGSVLAGNDHARGGFMFYMSRRINLVYYALGKLLAIGLFVLLITTLPAIVLFFEYGLLGDFIEYFSENFQIIFGILGYGFLLSIAIGLLLFALVSWMPRPVPLVILWGGLFVFLPILSRILAVALRDPEVSLEESSWRLLDFWNDLYIIGNKFFGVDLPLLNGAAIVVCGVCFFSIMAIFFRLRYLQHQS
ncbi:MAG: hypothetical protein CMO69_04490 [Verrucomicrobiales bacterium]|nr:hypothetical protein [Verrucomicrobiales bacterium]MBE86978.1 hypothetical protein [Verrucomicrobiales bacterium]|tara:strand:- start:57 stop:938 length:882 start_codon:yes stop_codon:yes gene_type:complete